jgi:GT2 family glycosyltransferase
MEVSHQLFFQIVNLFFKSKILAKKPQVLGACCGYKKYAFDKVGGFDEKLKTFEDLDLSERITKYGKIVFNNKTFAIT